MRSRTRALLSVFMSIVLVCGLAPFPAYAEQGPADAPQLTALGGDALKALVQSGDGGMTAQEEGGALSDTSNAWSHDYDRWTQTTTSFLHVNGGALERVEYTNGSLIVETVSSDYRSAISSKVIDSSTYAPSNLASGNACLWGGFFSGTSNNYVVTGQANGSENDDLVVFRITKYTKDWQYVNAAELRGANTIFPFDGGSCDMLEQDGKLYVRTCHKMYTTEDGLNHQANVQIVIDESSMSILESYYEIAGQWNAAGYVSHSFNQKLAALSGNVYGLDHGDADDTRGVTIKKLGVMYTGYSTILAAPEDSNVHYNYTGMSVGGFEPSSSSGKLLSVGNWSYDQTSSSTVTRDIWIAATSPSDFSTSYRRITSYDASSTESADTPFLVKINENRFLVLWGVKASANGTHTGELRYLFVDGNGNSLGSVSSVQGVLSDCQPVLRGDEIVWYAADGGKPSFYRINAFTGAYSKTEDLSAASIHYEGEGLNYYDWRTGSFVHALPFMDVETCPETTVTMGGRTLTEGQDYTLSYAIDKVNCKGTITAVGIGIYEGSSKSVSFDIIPHDASYCYPSFETQVYTGEPLEPIPTITFYTSGPNGEYIPHTLSGDEGFEITYSNNVNVGTASATIVGTGVIQGTMDDATFQITRCPLPAGCVSVSGSFAYTGQAQTPAPTVTVNGRELVSGTDYTVSYRNNTAVGTATVTVSGKGNYTGSVSTTFVITGPRVQRPQASNYVYDGGLKTGVPAGEGYTLSGDYQATDAGTYTAIATPSGNYAWDDGSTEPIELNWTIDARTLQPNCISGLVSKTYNGLPQTQQPVVTDGGKTLMEGADYTLSYSNNVNAGVATVTVTGQGNYQGTASSTFLVLACNLSNATVSGLESKTYNGQEQTQSPVVVLDGKELVEGADYDLSFSNNVNAGTAIVTVTGKNNYTSSCEGSFTIEPRTIGTNDISGIVDKTYDGTQQTQNITVTVDGKVLEEGTDYTVTYGENVNAGFGSVTVTGKGNYTGIAAMTFIINGRPLPGCATPIVDKTYDGTPQTHDIVLIDRGKVLVEGVDYRVTYRNNVNVGTARVTITGLGNYNTTTILSGSFEILPRDVSDAIITGVVTKGYDGQAQTQAPTVIVNGRQLEESTDYDLSYSDNVEIGTATMTVAGKGNYTGTAQATFQIVPPEMLLTDLSSATVTIPEATRVFNWAAHEPEPTVVLDGNTLQRDVDYTVSYSDNVNAGTATVTVTGAGDYRGSASVAFAIGKADLADAPLMFVMPTQYYTGAPKEPSFSSFPVLGDGEVLGTITEGVDYSVSYSNNVNAGSASFTLTALPDGNYTGTYTGAFTIEPAPIADALWGAVGENLVYTGDPITSYRLILEFNGTSLVEDQDYDLAYSNNVNAGTATVTATGKGNYAGTVSDTFVIQKAELPPIGEITNKVYDGTPQTQDIVMRHGNRTLVENVDFKAAYSNNVNAGVAGLDISGMGNYREDSTAACIFWILPRDISDAAFEGVVDKVYNGEAQTQSATVTVNGRQLVEGTDYDLSYSDNVEIGTAIMTVAGKGNYTGTAQTTFQIALQKATCPEAESFVYDGSLKTGVRYGEGYLLTGMISATAVGSYAVMASLQPGWTWDDGGTGAKLLTWKILPRNLSDAQVSGVIDKTYDGKAQTQDMTVTVGGRALAEGTDFSVIYLNNVNVGTAYAVLVGKGNYEGVKVAPFQVAAQREWSRIAGSTRYATMQQINAAGWTTSSTAIVATGANFPDALAASALAGAYGCPIVTVPSDAAKAADVRSLDTALDELARLKVRNVVVLGGTGAVSDVVVNKIKGVHTVKSVKRIAGNTRYTTPVEVYKQYKAAGGASDTVIVANGATFGKKGFEGALSISPYAFQNKIPIFLANGAKGLTAKAAVDAIKGDPSVRNVIIVSNGDVDPAAVKSQLGSGYSYTELVGGDTYSMNREVVAFELAHGMQLGRPLVATGENFPDALCGGALAGRWGVPLVLVRDASSAGVDELAAGRSGIDHGYVLGGPNALSDATCEQIAARTGMRFDSGA